MKINTSVEKYGLELIEPVYLKQNLPPPLGYVIGIRTDILSKFVVFVKSRKFLCLTHSSLGRAFRAFGQLKKKK